MFKKFTSLNALHHDIHLFECFKCITHFYNIWMRNWTDDLYLISEKFSFLPSQLLLVYQLHCKKIVIVFWSALVQQAPAKIHSGKLSFAEEFHSLIFLCQIEILSMFLDGTDPLLCCFIVSMKVPPLFEVLWIMIETESFNSFVEHRLHIQTIQIDNI